jgi:hypothetical protein
MGKIKDHLLLAEEAVGRAVDRRLARVSAGGGDAMSGGVMAVIANLEKEAAARGLTLEQLAEAEEASLAHGALAVADQSDKELERDEDGITPEQYAAANEATEQLDNENVVDMGIMENMPAVQYKHRGFAHTLVFQGVCQRCCHCGMVLTDSLSVTTGMGPVCRKRGGYKDEPANGDDMQALIDLAEYPQLVDFLTTNFKPKGKRAMMNALVRIASLNRKSPVHQAICDAVESLGWATLASVLRESIAVIEVKNHDDKTLHVWVKRSEWNYSWQSDLRQIPGAYLSRQYKGWLVPKAHKQLLWAYMLKHYAGFCAKVPTSEGKRTVKITAAYQPSGVSSAS